MQDEKPVARVGVSMLALKFNLSSSTCSCPLCGRPLAATCGPAIFLDGTESIVCRHCAQGHAPHLVALLDVAEEAEECGGLEDLKPHYAQVHKLWRAIEDYYEQLECLYDESKIKGE